MRGRGASCCGAFLWQKSSRRAVDGMATPILGIGPRASVSFMLMERRLQDSWTFRAHYIPCSENERGRNLSLVSQLTFEPAKPIRMRIWTLTD